MNSNERQENGIEKKWQRNCPICKDVLIYGNKYRLNHANKLNTLCNSCCQIGKTQSRETIEKRRKKLQGKIPWNKGKTGVYSASRLKQMSELHTGKEVSIETRKKLSDSLTGKVKSKSSIKKALKQE